MGQAQGPTGVSSLQSPFRCLRRYGPCRGDRVTAPTPRTATPFLMLCPTIPAKCLPTSAYRGNHLGDAVRAKGGRPLIVATAMWGRDEAESSTHGTNRSTKFGTCSRMRWRGLAKAAVQIRRTAIAYSMKHSLMVASSRPSLKPSHRFRASAPEIPWRSICNALPALFAAVSDVQPPTDTNFVFARSETSHPRLCAADGAALPKQSILWMHLIQTIDFTDQNNFH